MKSLLVLLILFISLSCSGDLDSPKSNPNDSSDVVDIKKYENNLEHGIQIEKLRETRAVLKIAMLDGDVETLNQIYSENYKIVTRKGILITRSERIDGIKSGKPKYLNLGVESEVSFEVYEKIVVVRGIVSSAETEFDGERRKSGPRRFTEIWINDNSDWKQISRQSTSVVDSAP